MKKNTDIKTLSDKLFSAKRVVLFPHENPDGDSTGACTALSLALREAGADVLGIVSIFTYGMQKSFDMLKEHNVENHSLCNLDTLVEVAAETDYIKPEEKEGILAFRDDPLDESWMTMV